MKLQLFILDGYEDIFITFLSLDSLSMDGLCGTQCARASLRLHIIEHPSRVNHSQKRNVMRARTRMCGIISARYYKDFLIQNSSFQTLSLYFHTKYSMSVCNKEFLTVTPVNSEIDH